MQTTNWVDAASIATRFEIDQWRPVVDLTRTLLGSSPDARRSEVMRQLTASVVHAPPGLIDIAGITEDPDGWIGLLVLDGVLMVEVEAGRAHTGWLIGGDDVVRPWDMAEISLTRPCRWRALTPTRIALLDREFSRRAGGAPVLARALVARTARTTNWLMAKSLVLASPVVEERLLLAFALLGERWGTVNRDGILLRLPLTHRLLATLCGVRRPSVTIALGSLEMAGIITRIPRVGWLLRRDTAAPLAERPSCWLDYAEALGFTATNGAAERAAS